MSSKRAHATGSHNLLTSGFVSSRDELVRCVQDGVERLVDAQLAGGHPIFFSGVGPDAQRLFMQTPDGQRSEYWVGADGSREVLRDDAS